MSSVHYGRSYTSARSMLGILEVGAWVAFCIGLIDALIGFATGGIFGAFGVFGASGDAPFAARLLSTIPGLTLSLSAFFLVCWVQVSRATVDTADMMREVLHLAQGVGNRPPPTTASSQFTQRAPSDRVRPNQSSPTQTIDLSSATIARKGRKFLFAGLEFSTIKGVQLFILEHGTDRDVREIVQRSEKAGLI